MCAALTCSPYKDGDVPATPQGTIACSNGLGWPVTNHLPSVVPHHDEVADWYAYLVQPSIEWVNAREGPRRGEEPGVPDVAPSGQDKCFQHL